MTEDFGYNPDQERDDNGRWAGGGGGGGGGDGGGAEQMSGASNEALIKGSQASNGKLAKHSAKADRATKKAVKSGKPEDHEEAALLHREAAAVHRNQGGNYGKHEDATRAHSRASALHTAQAEALRKRAKMSDDDSAITFATLPATEIFATGTWNGIPFNEADLDGIVRSFDALDLGGKIPLKLGHSGPDVRDDPTTQFAMGWVQRIWRDGRKLFADVEVPEVVNGLLKNKFLKFVSVELLKNVRAATSEIPWVLDAVALLGSDRPAVGVLKDIQALSMSRRETSLSCSGRVTFARADYQPTISSGEQRNMSGDNNTPTLQELMDKMLSMQNQMNDVLGENRTLKAQVASFSQTKQQLADMKEANEKRERDERRAALKAEFERAIQADEIVPAARERFMKVYRIEDDETVMAVTIDDAKEFIRENPNPLPKRKPKVTTFSLERPDQDVPYGTRPDDEALLRAQALLRSRSIHSPSWEQLAGAVKELFSSNPQLGERYKFMPDALARDANRA